MGFCNPNAPTHKDFRRLHVTDIMSKRSIELMNAFLRLNMVSSSHSFSASLEGWKELPQWTLPSNLHQARAAHIAE